MLRLSDSITAAMPVVLAPMAGITNTAFRTLCREQGPGGLYVSEMITSRALVERNPKTLQLMRFAPAERPRSVQLYGVDPEVIAAAVRHHRRGRPGRSHRSELRLPGAQGDPQGRGAALPWHSELFTDIVASAVRAADGLPVTVKMRMGIDADHLTFRDAAQRAQDAGVAWVALHARTAQDYYGGQADWAAIAELVELLDIPVLGNGDIWEADDAVRMVAETGCAGVVVGRGCLGRPWLFADLAAAFAGRPDRGRPTLGAVAAMIRRHGELLADWLGETHGLTDLRKHMAWYLKGFGVGGEIRSALAQVSSFVELDDLLGKLDADQPFPDDVLGRPRGRTTGGRAVSLPEGWLADRGSRLVPVGAEREDSGG